MAFYFCSFHLRCYLISDWVLFDHKDGDLVRFQMRTITFAAIVGTVESMYSRLS